MLPIVGIMAAVKAGGLAVYAGKKIYDVVTDKKNTDPTYNSPLKRTQRAAATNQAVKKALWFFK